MTSDEIAFWRYGLTRTTHGDETSYEIRELYFNDAGEVVAWTSTEVTPHGETVVELQDSIARYADAAQGPDVFDIDVRRWLPVPTAGESQITRD